MNLITWIGLLFWSLICFSGGLLFYSKVLDKPENLIKKIKTRGKDNVVDIKIPRKERRELRKEKRHRK